MTMILINGPFGIGKSTVSDLVAKRRVDAMVFDPEVIGSLLHRLVPASLLPGDYQDLALWRQMFVMNARLVQSMTGRDLVIPMNLWRREYFDEITSGLSRDDLELTCFRLTCSESTLRARILGRPDEEGGHEWCLSHMASGLAAARDPHFGVEIDTEGKTPAHVADIILAHLNA